MRGTLEQHKPNRVVREHLLGRLGSYGAGAGELATNDWSAEFHKAFDLCASPEELISDENVAAAIGAYQRSQVFVDTPWLTPTFRAIWEPSMAAARRGACCSTGMQHKAARSCCVSARAISSPTSSTTAGRAAGRTGQDDSTYCDDDYGRFRVTGRPADLYAFRTPTLLNVAVTGPYSRTAPMRRWRASCATTWTRPRPWLRTTLSQLDPSVQTEHMAYNATCAGKLDENRSLDLPAIEPMMLSVRRSPTWWRFWRR
ncbi:MAG: hypothetical protein R2844_15410 [Caldilineales bacterium]